MPQFSEIERSRANTKAIIVNSPNNPSGDLSARERSQLVELCESRDIFLIMDDIYHKLVFDGACTVSAYDYTNRDVDSSNIVLVNGVSKLYGMTGFRIGWAVGPRRLIEVMTAIQAQTTSCPAVPSQAAAEGALTGVQSVVENLRLTIQNNRDVMMAELQGLEGVRVEKPLGTFYCLPDFRAYNTNSVELATFLLNKALVVTVPGAPFGMEGHLRAELRRLDQRDYGRHRADQVGARSMRRTKSILVTANWSGTGYEQPAQHQDRPRTKLASTR